MKYVECRTLYNKTRRVPTDTMIQRPSVYGIVVWDSQMLVAKASHTQKYVLPGGGIERGEAVEAALEREIMEETGITVEVREFLHFETDFFYYDPQDLAIHGFLFFYHCQALTTALVVPEYHPNEGLDYPEWRAIESLTADDFQTHGETAMRLAAKYGSR